MAARVRDHVLAARAAAVVAAGGLEAADELKLGNSIAV
uniref:Uncharacterized protein n=1 Tax=Arundo donax TaxID=35708 RepID=A0A0A9BC05_ARUDO